MFDSFEFQQVKEKLLSKSEHLSEEQKKVQKRWLAAIGRMNIGHYKDLNEVEKCIFDLKNRAVIWHIVFEGNIDNFECFVGAMPDEEFVKEYKRLFNDFEGIAVGYADWLHHQSQMWTSVRTTGKIDVKLPEGL